MLQCMYHYTYNYHSTVLLLRNGSEPVVMSSQCTFKKSQCTFHPSVLSRSRNGPSQIPTLPPSSLSLSFLLRRCRGANSDPGTGRPARGFKPCGLHKSGRREAVRVEVGVVGVGGGGRVSGRVRWVSRPVC